MNRRGFLGAILAAGAAPAVVRASSLMKIVTPVRYQITALGGGVWTPSMVAREALVILYGQLLFEVSTDYGISYFDADTVTIKRPNPFVLQAPQ